MDDQHVTTWVVVMCGKLQDVEIITEVLRSSLNFRDVYTGRELCIPLGKINKEWHHGGEVVVESEQRLVMKTKKKGKKPTYDESGEIEVSATHLTT